MKQIACCSKWWATIGAVSAGLAVILGALSAHGLEDILIDRYSSAEKSVAGHIVPASWKYLQDFKSAAQYQMYHSIGLILVGLLSAQGTNRKLQLAGYAFAGGIVLFSGALYVLALTGQTWLGAIAPIGGTLFIVGWFALAAALCPCSRDTNVVTLDSSEVSSQ